MYSLQRRIAKSDETLEASEVLWRIGGSCVILCGQESREIFESRIFKQHRRSLTRLPHEWQLRPNGDQRGRAYSFERQRPLIMMPWEIL